MFVSISGISLCVLVLILYMKREILNMNDVSQSVPYYQGLSQDFQNASKTAIPKFLHSDLATQLLQILIPTTFNSLLCQNEQIYNY